jgi:hypothetical protein
VVDDVDYDRVSAYSWYLLSNPNYPAVQARVDGRWVRIGRFVLGADDDGVQVDHINRDPFDNRRSNLRLASHSQNQSNQSKRRTNTSGYKGVFRTTQNERTYWQAQIAQHRRKYTLGVFQDVVEAAQNYDAFALLLQGEFAVLNFPDADYSQFTPKRLKLYESLRHEIAA